jgi:hypothetical protein
LRTLSDGVTTVDGLPVAKGVEVPVRSGTRIGVANTLTLRLAGPAHAVADDEDSRTMVINPDSVS